MTLKRQEDAAERTKAMYHRKIFVAVDEMVFCRCAPSRTKADACSWVILPGVIEFVFAADFFYLGQHMRPV